MLGTQKKGKPGGLPFICSETYLLGLGGCACHVTVCPRKKWTMIEMTAKTSRM
jgi:hypothetical protein